MRPGAMIKMGYVPILKGKPGEFLAWKHASTAVRIQTRPLFEVVPSGQADRDLALFVQRLSSASASGDEVIVDSTNLNQALLIEDDDRVVRWTANRLAARNIGFRPVVRLGMADEVLADVVYACDLHESGICLRLGSALADPDARLAARGVPELLDALRLSTPNVDLVIDMWAVTSERDAARAAPIAVAVLEWAASIGSWRSVSVASGAFPASVSTFPPGEATPVHRFDAEMHDLLVGEGPDFGDFGINHPAMPPPGRGPLPSLRYTYGRDWYVYRERRALPGNQSFFTLCTRVVASSYWPESGANYSWGDSEIARCAAFEGSAGGATEWRAYGTSHHLAHVVDRLANLGEP